MVGLLRLAAGLTVDAFEHDLVPSPVTLVQSMSTPWAASTRLEAFGDGGGVERIAPRRAAATSNDGRKCELAKSRTVNWHRVFPETGC